MRRALIKCLLVVRSLSSDTIFKASLALVGCVVACVLGLSLPRGLGFADEAWYLILLRDRVVETASAWSLLFSWLPNNVLVIRIATVSLVVVGNCVLGWGVYAFFKNRLQLKKSTGVLLSVVAFVGSFVFGNLVFVPSYSYLNHVLFQAGVGLILLGVSGTPSCFFFAGLALGMLPFVMMPNSVFLMVALAYICTTKDRRLGGVLYIAGVLVAAMLFFCFVESPSRLYQAIKSGDDLANTKHGLLPMVKWTLLSSKYIVSNIVSPVILIAYLSKKCRGSRAIGALEAVGLGSVGLCVVLPYLTAFAFSGPPVWIYPFESIALLAGWAIVEDLTCFGVEEWAMIALFASIPFCASLGTVVDFSLRGSYYVGAFWGTLGVCLLFDKARMRLRSAACFVMAMLTLGYVISFFKPNWSTVQSLSSQCVPVPEYSRGLFLSPGMAEHIREIEKYVGRSNYVVLSDCRSWWIAYLLNLKPVSYAYLCNDRSLVEKIKCLPVNKVYLIDTPLAPFTSRFWVNLEANSGWIREESRDVSSGETLYRVVRKTSK